MRARSLGGSAARRWLLLGLSGCITNQGICTRAAMENPSLSRFAAVMCANGHNACAVSGRCHSLPVVSKPLVLAGVMRFIQHPTQTSLVQDASASNLNQTNGCHDAVARRCIPLFDTAAAVDGCDEIPIIAPVPGGICAAVYTGTNRDVRSLAYRHAGRF